MDARALGTCLAVATLLIVLGASDGGYFPSSWGWSALLACLVALVAVLVRDRVEIGRLEAIFLGGLCAFLAWIALSLLWTPTQTQTVFEIERTLSYLAFAVALAVVARRVDAPFLVGAALVAAVALCGYGLATRLLPEQLGTFDATSGNRLGDPLGYWNALAATAAIGCILAFGLVARAEPVVVRALSASSLVVLFPTLYFTFGRGGWLALFVALAALLALAPRRLQLITALLVVLPWPALALWLSYEAKGLTTPTPQLATASTDGRRLIVLLGVLAVAAAGATAAYVLLERRISPPVTLRRAYAAVLGAAALVALGVGLVLGGGPVQIADDALNEIREPPRAVTDDLTQRLFSLSNSGRLAHWEVSWDAFKREPILGTGAGSFEQEWAAHRPTPGKVRDAHSLYVETASDLGLVGVLLLAVLVVVPLVAAVRARSSPFVPIAAAGFVAYLVHAGIDWDWEMPVVTLLGITCASAILISARGTLTIGLARLRIPLAALLVAASAFGFVAMTGNRYLAQATSAQARDDAAGTLKYARRAEGWMPWSSHPLALQADVALEQARLARARELYRQAIEKDPSNWELWLGLALASEGSAQQRALAETERLNPLSTELRQLRE
ncbi:MAG TPA: O-antigen ligase family protein [Gaiella sp.]